MGNIGEKIGPGFGKKTVLVIVLCSLVFVVALTLLFTQEKQKLDKDFENMITNSLNIHTHNNALHIDKTIADASSALQTAGAMLRLIDGGWSGGFAGHIDTMNPAYTVQYITTEDLEAGALSPLVQAGEKDIYEPLARGETVVSGIRYDEHLAGYYLAVIMPLLEDGAPTGALYTRMHASDLFPEVFESVVYQDVQSSLITSDGHVVFNTFQTDGGGNLFANLGQYGLIQAELDQIADVIASPAIDSATFNRNGQTYFVSADQLAYNDWYLVAFVRGPDVLLRSAGIFKDLIATSITSIVLTAAAVCVVFITLLASRSRLEHEQRRYAILAQRLQAMFNQHSALKLVFDAATGEIVDANPALCSYFGYTKDEVLGQRLQEFNLLPPTIQDEKFQGELNDGILFSAAPHRLRNGETRFLDVYASVILDGERRLLYAILFDATDRETYRNELFKEKKLLFTTLQSIGDGVVTTDNLGIITSLNSVAETLTGWDNGLAIGRPFTDVFIMRSETSGEPVDNPVQKVLETGLVIGLANHTELITRQGGSIPIADSAAPIKAEDGQTFGVVMVFRDVSVEKEHSREIEFLSYHDPLTGLHNRRYLEEIISRLDTAEHLPVAVIMADVNGLKITNDVFGHKTGDVLLQNVAELLAQICPEDALTARLGGDEFVVLMPRTNLQQAEAVVREIKNTPVEIEGSNLFLSLSLGCACKETPDGSIQSAIQQAEEYMYHQKLLDGKSYRNAITSTLLATLYEKSNETEEHSKRIEKYCHAIGRKLQLSSKEMDELSLLALLHDVGKVSINPDILQKPGALSPAEWDEMKRHPEIGYRIAQATPELAIISDLILAHHEHWDGKGYPRGLKHEDIPLACRILAVADAFDAMTSERVYRRAISVEEAIRELESHAGTQFDPQMASLLIEIMMSADDCFTEGLIG